MNVNVLAATNAIGLVGFIGGDSSANLVWGVISCAVAFLGSAVITYLFGFTWKQLEEDAASVRAE